MSNSHSIKRVASSSDISNAELRKICESIEVPASEEFIAFTQHGQEVGLLSIEYFDWESFDGPRLAYVHKIFVLSAYRRRGIGSALLAKAEQVALEGGFSIVSLRPWASEKELDRNSLVDWYKREGYDWINDDDRMEKRI